MHHQVVSLPHRPVQQLCKMCALCQELLAHIGTYAGTSWVTWMDENVSPEGGQPSGSAGPSPKDSKVELSKAFEKLQEAFDAGNTCVQQTYKACSDLRASNEKSQTVRELMARGLGLAQEVQGDLQKMQVSFMMYVHDVGSATFDAPSHVEAVSMMLHVAACLCVEVFTECQDILTYWLCVCLCMPLRTATSAYPCTSVSGHCQVPLCVPTAVVYVQLASI
eukprot:5108156-Alexandrium_andersonii.AAC.1